METLWPERRLPAVSNSLRVAIHHLRASLAKVGSARSRDAFVVFEGGGYSLSPDLDMWVDVEDYEGAWRRGRSLEIAGDVRQALTPYGTAEALYRGDFLADWPYDEWTILRREALKDIQLTVLGKISAACILAGDYEGCVERCQKILALDPTREDAYQWIIRAHIALGHLGRAKSWYALCVRALRELDMNPSEETTALAGQIGAHAD